MRGKINSFSKEAIKVRMLQNAVKIWGLKSISSIDPFVTLLIDSFSTEIFKANNEIQTVQSRILEKLARLLTPSIYTFPQPSHAIAFTRPDEDVEILPNHSEFFITKQFPSTAKGISDIQLDIHFTPVDYIKLVNMQTVILFSAQTCYQFDEEQNKIPIAKVPSLSIAHNKLILGIDASHYNNEMFPDKLSLYCSNPSFEYIDFVFKLLPFVSIKNNDLQLDVKPGLSYEEQFSMEEGYEEIFKEYSMRTLIEENIKNIYKEKFIEITGLTPNSISDTIPAFLEFVNGKKEITNIIEGKRIIWLEMIFPPQFTTEMLDSFSFTMNAFPVYNRRWKNNEYSLDIMGDNIPLSTDIGEHFLYVEEVQDSFGNKYQEIPFSKTNDLNKGLYTIRTGGMERFNERNAVEMISNVLELTRDEVSAFGVLDRDKVVEALKGMIAQMQVLEQKVVNADRNTNQEINYVIVDPIESIEHLRASYWVTNCTLANNIRKGTNLAQPKITKVNLSKNLNLLTETIGGSNEQKGTDAIQAYKYALTTRDKIISIEDIKSYCKLVLKNQIKSIQVRRGTIVSNKPKEGFIRTIEIEIAPSSYSYLGKNYWENFSITLRNQIMLKGIDGIEYIVNFINKDDD